MRGFYDGRVTENERRRTSFHRRSSYIPSVFVGFQEIKEGREKRLEDVKAEIRATEGRSSRF